MKLRSLLLGTFLGLVLWAIVLWFGGVHDCVNIWQNHVYWICDPR